MIGELKLIPYFCTLVSPLGSMLFSCFHALRWMNSNMLNTIPVEMRIPERIQDRNQQNFK